MIAGTTVTLLVSGSIAAYKSAELVRELIRRGAEVNVVMSKASREFITALTMQTLSGRPVTTELFDERQEAEISHIALADSADVVLVAPATADIIAKAALGLADDILSTVILATKAPLVFCPAMNVNMWTNTVTQRNVSELRARGARFVEPEEGELACGWVGPGRLAETEAIVQSVSEVCSPKDLRGSHVLVTAGPTREAIDPVRFVSNRSSGKMGFAIARDALLRGATVSLVSGPTSLRPPRGVSFHPVTSAKEMHQEVFQLLLHSPDTEGTSGRQYVFMAAAVTDHRPAEAAASKLKPDKSKDYELRMTPNVDILEELGTRREEIRRESGRSLTLVGFTVETGDEAQLLSSAKKKLEQKSIDLIVGNLAQDAFERDTNRVWLLDRLGHQEEVQTADKELVATRIVSAALRI